MGEAIRCSRRVTGARRRPYVLTMHTPSPGSRWRPRGHIPWWTKGNPAAASVQRGEAVAKRVSGNAHRRPRPRPVLEGPTQPLVRPPNTSGPVPRDPIFVSEFCRFESASSIVRQVCFENFSSSMTLAGERCMKDTNHRRVHLVVHSANHRSTKEKRAADMLSAGL